MARGEQASTSHFPTRGIHSFETPHPKVRWIGWLFCVLAVFAGCSKDGDPGASDKEAQAGLAAYRAKQFDSAVEHFREATKSDASNRHAWFGLGASALRQKQAAPAKDAFEKFLALAPRDPSAEAGLGLAFNLLGDKGNALVHVNHAVNFDDSDAAVADLKKRLDADAPIDTVALAAIDARIELIDKKLRETAIVRLQILGLNHVRDTHYDVAEKAYDAASRLDPSDPVSLLGLGASAMRSEANHIDRAMDAIEEYVKLEPDSAAGTYCLGAIRSRRFEQDGTLREHLDEIESLYARAEKAAPNDQDIVFAHAAILKSEESEAKDDGHPQSFGAFEKFQRSLELNPYCPSTHKNLQQYYQDREDEVNAKIHKDEYSRLTSGANAKRFPARNTNNPWTPLIEKRLERIDRSKVPAADAGLPSKLTFGFVETALPKAPAAAITNVDGDCALDVVLTDGTVARNLGNGSFEILKDAIPAAIAAQSFTEVHAADIDNDDAVDLVFAGNGHLALLIGDGKGHFTDRTQEAGLAGIAAQSAVLFDYDHEGDIDLLLLVANLSDEPITTKMMRNNLPPRIPRNSQPDEIAAFNAVKLSFTDVTTESGIVASGVNLHGAFGDVENGNDTDVVLLGKDRGFHFTNLRGGKFKDIAESTGVKALRGFRCELADLDSDGWLDLLSIDGEGVVQFSRNRGDGTFLPPAAIELGCKATSFTLFDHDNDGSLDLAIATEKGARLLRNVRGKFEDASTGTKFGVLAEPNLTFAIGDFDQDGDDDALALDPASAPRILRNDGGNQNHRITLTMQGDLSNHMAIGAKVEVADLGFFVKREVNGLPVTIGVGPRTLLSSLFVLWTNGVRQPYRDVDLTDTAWMKKPDYDRSAGTIEIEPHCPNAAGAPGWLIRQIIRQEGSCPLLYACDGVSFHYVTDALCSAVLGLDIGNHQRAMPNPSDAVRVRGDQLKPQNGRLKLAFTEELRELTYLDWVRLVAVDHPTGTQIFTDNKFTFPPFPPYEIHKTAATRPIVKAIDSHGDDVTSKLAAPDDAIVDSFRRCAPPMQGMAEMHTLELDLGDVSQAKTLRLFLQGWFYWTNSSVNDALAQSALPEWEFMPPMIDVADGKGGWIPRGMAGIPAGNHKLILVDLSDAFPKDAPQSKAARVRLTTNLQIYWDHAFIATDDDPSAVPMTTHELPPLVADLHYRGYSKQVYPGAHGDKSKIAEKDYLYDEVTRDGTTYGTYYGNYIGRLTRYGDVNPLLSDIDDQFVILQHGDELSLEFDANALPPLKDGWTRDYVFRSFGYAKDMDHNTAAATTVEPLPFRAMSAYPPPPGEAYPQDAAHQKYRAEWNTRISTGKPMTAPPRPSMPPVVNAPHVVLTDVTQASGIRFHHAEGRNLVNLEDTMGAGCAWGDYDGDGDDDLFLVQGAGPGYADVYSGRYHHVLYRNDGAGPTGGFTDVTEEANVAGYGRGMAALFADLDNDGDLDLFVTQLGENLLYRNDGHGRFRDVTAFSGVAGAGYHSGVAAGDYDRDGDLDLYVSRYVTIDEANRPQEAQGFHRGFVRDDPPSVLPMMYMPAPKTLWRNDGDLKFTDVTAQAGVADEQGKGMGVLMADFDLDGWPDLFCANDVTVNNFFRNKGDGTFESLAFDVGLDDPRGGMGVALADVDDDTDLDLAVTYWQLEPDALYRNNVIRKEQKRKRIPTFEDIGVQSGFADGSVGRVKWGVSISDLDCDSHLDSFIVTGYTSPDYETTTLCVPQRALLAFGSKEGRFVDVTSADYGSFFGYDWNGRGLAASDYDGDGDLDFCVTQNNGDAILLRNDGGSRGNWLEVDLEGDGKKIPKDPAGARVTIELGGRKLTRVLLLGSSYLCGESHTLHFGLGEIDHYDSLTVTWPGGRVTKHSGGKARERVRIVAPSDS